MIFTYDCKNLTETIHLGKTVGERCRGGEIFFLYGDLGAGKTSFTRGLVSAIADPELVTSPSFTINNTYVGEGLRVEHFDFYRLGEPGIMAEEFKEAVDDSSAIIVVEWGEAVSALVNKDIVVIAIETQVDESRRYTIQIPSILEYLGEDKR